MTTTLPTKEKIMFKKPLITVLTLVGVGAILGAIFYKKS